MVVGLGWVSCVMGGAGGGSGDLCVWALAVRLGRRAGGQGLEKRMLARWTDWEIDGVVLLPPSVLSARSRRGAKSHVGVGCCLLDRKGLVVV